MSGSVSGAGFWCQTTQSGAHDAFGGRSREAATQEITGNCGIHGITSNHYIPRVVLRKPVVVDHLRYEMMWCLPNCLGPMGLLQVNAYRVAIYIYLMCICEYIYIYYKENFKNNINVNICVYFMMT